MRPPLPHHLPPPPKDALAHLVEATNDIGTSGTRFVPTPDQITHILNAPRLAADFLRSPAYHQVETALQQRAQTQKAAILDAARIDNVNLRGNRTEALLSRAATDHDLADLALDLGGGLRLLLDLKTKLLDRSSSPKAYSIDKLLRALADGRTAYGFAFLSIDPGRGEVHLKVIYFLDATVLAATRIQYHWAGCGSRGVTQLAGSMDILFQPGFVEQQPAKPAPRPASAGGIPVCSRGALLLPAPDRCCCSGYLTPSAQSRALM